MELPDIKTLMCKKFNSEKKRMPAIFRCLLFNCAKSIDMWQCCYYCEDKKRCVKRCNNNPKKCGGLIVDNRVKNY